MLHKRLDPNGTVQFRKRACGERNEVLLVPAGFKGNTSCQGQRVSFQPLLRYLRGREICACRISGKSIRCLGAELFSLIKLLRKVANVAAMRFHLLRDFRQIFRVYCGTIVFKLVLIRLTEFTLPGNNRFIVGVAAASGYGQVIPFKKLNLRHNFLDSLQRKDKAPVGTKERIHGAHLIALRQRVGIGARHTGRVVQNNFSEVTAAQLHVIESSVPIPGTCQCLLKKLYEALFFRPF